MMEQEYLKLLDRITKGAEYLANPLIKPQDFEKGMQLYNSLCERLEKLKGEMWGA